MPLILVYNYVYPRVAKKKTKKNSNKHKKQLMGEVGMAVQKRTLTREVHVVIIGIYNKVHLTSLLLFTEIP